MNTDSKEYHTQHVMAWLERQTIGLSVDQILHLLNDLTDLLWSRLRITLSDITLISIVDRALCLSQEKFPLLDHLQLDANGVCFDKLFKIENTFTPNELIQAYGQFLIETISIISVLTAGILTPILYRELDNFSMTHRSSAPQEPKEQLTKNKPQDSTEDNHD